MITCPACASENPPNSRFCGNCGTPLARTCPSCGSQNPPANNYCAACGTPLRSESAQLEQPAPTPVSDSGERRLVSVLFADLVGFTTFSESRDPEEVRAMLTRYFERARDVIERFGGEVDKFIGDAVTAFWGAAQALEDDAERAVRAALELVDAVEALGTELGIPELAVRVGVLSGETSVGSGGNEKGLVVGDVVNTASRLQSAAEPRTVLVGQTTKQLTEAAIRYESVGERSMKGKALPVAAWQALSVIGERRGKGRDESLEPPFVGREDELRLLKDQVHATTRDGVARLVSIVGEAGIGKSRLAWELRKYLDGLTENFRWHRGRSPAYGDGVTFWALAEMVRSRAGISEGENPLKARTKLRTVVAAFVPDPEEQQWIETRLAGLLGLDDMPSGDRNELYASLRAFFQRVSDTGTTVLLFEDLQWADDGQLEFIEELVEMSHHHPILVITLARPEILDRRPRWGAARHNFLSVRLGPLSDVRMAELVTGLVPGISEATLALLIERAGGVPMYAVEYVRMLVNAGDLVPDGPTFRQTRELTDVALPDSLHALVGARLDRLDESNRSLIQDAAVLGQSFTLEGMTVLREVGPDELERRLRDLVRHDLLRYDDDPRSPERGQFQFVQSVIREVAYGRTSKAGRKDKHLRVAEYYEREAPVEAAAVIASHYMSAFEADADSRLADKARAALMNAARRAVELKSHAQALALAEQALDVPGTDGQRAPLWEFVPPSAAALFRNEEAIQYARRAHEWYAEHGSEEDVVRSAHVLGTAHIDADEPFDAVASMASFFDPERAGEPEMLTLGADLARAQMRANQMQQSADVSLAVMIAAEAHGNLPVLIDSMNTRGSAISRLGRRAEAIALLRETLRLAEAAAFPYQILRAINNLNVEQAIDGLAALSSRRRGFELARRVRHGGLLARFTVGYAIWLYHSGRFDEALGVLDESESWEWSLWSDFAGASTELVQWAQTGDTDHLAKGRELNRPLMEAHEPQYRAGGFDNDARFLWLLGDLPGAYDLAYEVDPPLAHNDHRHTAVGAAVRLKDEARLRRAADLLEVPYGRRFDLLRLAIDAGLEFLEGDPDRAALMFRNLVDGLDEAESPLIGAEWKAIFAEVMPERPEARDAAREAYDWFSSVGAQGYLDLWGHVWEQAELRGATG
jgi:class 3 adenylate cyclase/tetratricopeptide (TPR) repeat protein